MASPSAAGAPEVKVAGFFYRNEEVLVSASAAYNKVPGTLLITK
jgi:hypothetical protein